MAKKQSGRTTKPQKPEGQACPEESSVQSAAHIEAVARKAWQTYCHFESLGSRIDTVAKFDGYVVKVSIKPTQVSHDDELAAAD